MSQTYHQLDAEQSEVGSLLRFGLKSIAVLTLIAMGFLIVVSLRPSTSSPSTADHGAMAHSGVQGSISVTAFDLGFKPSTLEVTAAGDYEVTLVNTGSAPPALRISARSPSSKSMRRATAATLSPSAAMPSAKTEMPRPI